MSFVTSKSLPVSDVGPPGSGKATLVRSLAAELGLQLIEQGQAPVLGWTEAQRVRVGGEGRSTGHKSGDALGSRVEDVWSSPPNMPTTCAFRQTIK